MRPAHRCAVLLLTLVTTSTLFAQDQRRTIPEIVASGAAGRISQSCGLAPLPPFSDLLHQTDLLVAGTVGESRSYLSDDERDVYTDRALEPVRVYYRRPVPAPTALLARPGVVPERPIAITELGGTIVVSGQSFTQDVRNQARKLTPGMTGLFLLTRKELRYWVTSSTLGAFEIENDRLRPLVARADFAREYRSVPVGAAIRAMLDILHRQ
jgi:hypothetical protein